MSAASASARGPPSAAPRLGGDQLRPVMWGDFMAAKKAIRVSVSKKSSERDLLARWHERFGEGTNHADIERIGF